jgi:aminomethyltransferase
MKHTPLFDRHVREAAAVLNLKGTARPVQYAGHIAEHRATREAVTLCDVSHMGELDFKGRDALALVQKLVTNDASRLAVNQAMYSAMCADDGMVIDDLVCFRLGEDHFRWVVNVTKIEEDYHWVLRHAAGMDVRVNNISTDTALLALQGPKSLEALQRLTKADLSKLPYYWLVQTVMYTEHAEVPVIISRTGYTGERGFEIMVARELAVWVWDEVLVAARPLGIIPHGVAARESLRTEAGYLLNGNDMDAQTNPYEAGLGWVVKLSKDFIGKEALTRIKSQGVSRKMVGLEVDGPLTMRNGYPIYRSGNPIGQVSSGPLSPALTGGRNLALGYVTSASAELGSEIEIEIRGRRMRGRVVALPFCARRAKEEPAVITYSPYELRYTSSHVWVRPAQEGDGLVTLGLTDFGQRRVGDILSIDLPRIGDKIASGAAVAWVDTYRKALEIPAPADLEVIAVNEELLKDPTQINAVPYVQSGIVKAKLAAGCDYETMLTFEEYNDQIRRARRYDSWSAELRMT